RRAPSTLLSPFARRLIGIFFDVENSWHQVMTHSRVSVGPCLIDRHAIIGFLRGNLRNVPVEAELCEIRSRVGEWDVSLVDAVLQRSNVVAKPDVLADLEHPFAL